MFLRATWSVVLLIVALVTNYYANVYTSITASNSVTDLILDRIPVVDVHYVFIYGAGFFILALIAFLMYEPRDIPFVVKSIALFLVVRSFFMILTHIAPPIVGSHGYGYSALDVVSSGDDLFFSAHAGLPFMLMLIYWKRLWLRSFYAISTLIGAGSVLLGHLHYSIDVFSAFFIAYGIYMISTKFFDKDLELFLS